MTALIRAATRADAPVVFDLIRELATYERLADQVDSTQATIADALCGPDPRVCCDLAEQDGEAAGFAMWFYSFSTFRGRRGIYLEDLFVRPAHRGRGIGKALLAGLARRCVDEGLARLEWSVLDWNEPALGFYRGLGAVGLDGWTKHRLDGEALARLGGP